MSGASAGNLLSVVATTDANGEASAPLFTGNGNAGTYQVTAGNAGLQMSFNYTNLPTLNAAAVAGLTTTVSTPAFNLTTAAGPTPSGGTFTGPGVTGDNTFNPASAGALGSKTVTYTINGASVTFTILLGEAPSLVVTLAGDTVNNLDAGTSLREAVFHAMALGGAQTITFAPSPSTRAARLGASSSSPEAAS